MPEKVVFEKCGESEKVHLKNVLVTKKVYEFIKNIQNESLKCMRKLPQTFRTFLVQRNTY